MPKEVCWKCKAVKDGVKLCADDRLCPDCDRENDIALAALRVLEISSPACLDIVSAVGVPTEGIKQKKITRQSKKLVEEVKTLGGNPASTSASYQPSGTNLDCKNLEMQVSQLKTTVDGLNKIILKLSSQLDFVLSFLDIHEHTDEQYHTELGSGVTADSKQQCQTQTGRKQPRQPGVHLVLRIWYDNLFDRFRMS
jgi:hypothetical protein